MKSPDLKNPSIGPGLTLTFVLLMTVILGGNGLLIWQFHAAHLQTDRLTSVSQQLIAVLRLQEGLRSFHQRLDELAQSKDAHGLAAEARPLRAALLEQTQQTRSALALFPRGARVEPAFLPVLDAIDITLPAQLADITALATLGDWEAVRLRLDNDLKPVEALTSDLVKSIDQDVSEELPYTVTNMRTLQRKILLFVPATAIATFLIAAFFGWAIARRILQLRLEERVTGRTRIARELHDTLLQSFQGVLLRFQATINVLPDRPEEAKEKLEGAIEEAARAIKEGRDALQGLRSPTTEVNNDLAAALSTLGEQLAADRTDKNRPVFEVQVAGAPQDLDPILRDEVYRIAGEALRNAFRHAQARRIEAEIQYDEGQLRVRIRDDGKGMNSQIATDKGHAGHWGLNGMQERAKLVGGKLEVWSKLNCGTEIELSIPTAKV